VSEHANFITQLGCDIRDDIRQGRWETVSVDLDSLADTVVAALVEGRDDDIVTAAREVENAYSHCLKDLKTSDAGKSPDAIKVSGQLQAFTIVLNVACRHQRPLPEQQLLTQPSFRYILDALFETPGLSGRQLAEITNSTPETIARKLPMLRTAGLVKSRQVGRMVLNTITPPAERVLRIESEQRKNAEKASERRSVLAQSLEKRFEEAPPVIRRRGEFVHQVEKMEEFLTAAGATAFQVAVYSPNGEVTVQKYGPEFQIEVRKTSEEAQRARFWQTAAIFAGKARNSDSALDVVPSAAPTHQAASQVSAAHRSTAGQADYVRSRATDLASQVADQVSDLGRKHPLLLGAIGIAAGAAVGLAMRPTQSEDDVVGPYADSLKAGAREAFAEQYYEAVSAAEVLAEAFSEPAGRSARAQSPGIAPDPAADWETVIGGRAPVQGGWASGAGRMKP
jgi:DNA-binding transcriptional ArsR family regulator